MSSGIRTTVHDLLGLFHCKADHAVFVNQLYLYIQNVSHHVIERVTQCIVDNTKILGYVTVEYYRLYYRNIRSYLVEYFSGLQ
jgi:hypothetical protein